MKKGICHLSIVPVRAEASDRSELVTQLIFGDLYQILEFDATQKWCKIKIEQDQYEGWIDAKQRLAILDETFNTWKNASKQYVSNFYAIIRMNDIEFVIPEGATIALNDGIHFKSVDFNFSFYGSLRNYDKQEISKVAKRYEGSPYLWGGKTHFGIDCSGFVQQVLKQCATLYPRDAYQQAELGEAISLENAQKNDLAFFHNKDGKIIHVGILLDQQHIIHAHAKVRIDRIDEKGIWNDEINDYSHRLNAVKQIK